MILTRRKFLGAGITTLGTAVIAHFSIFRPASQWNIPAVLELKAGHSFDLKSTLPKDKFNILGRNKMYHFSVDPEGSPLPHGVSLSSDGLLGVDQDMGQVKLEGVVFSYSEKA